ncbi:hypothetical protein [Rhodococcus rhodochrous]|uniref:hypothetical protein n=1 Tax=Rhodococcus rhodochrous TaxID=1829 RepID=UPI001785470C|nr:hypothetical protein [Rhodococcus rhodochrous]QOH55234.1 hypothetical protein C6Y44_04045 [Rhodococcus rhodochrous]
MNRPTRRRHKPRIFTSPPSTLDMNLGSDLAEISEKAGRPLDTWQHVVLEKSSRMDTLAEDGTNPFLAGWTWSASEVGLLTGAQNGRTFVAEARALGGLLTLRDQVVYTLPSRQTAVLHFRSFCDVLESSAELATQVQGIHYRENLIVMRNGGSIRFCPRRSVTIDAAIDADLLVIDDAHDAPDEWARAAVHGTPFRKPQSPRRQVWYVGTAVHQDRHPNGRVFTAVRNRGLTGTDPSLCWIEYSVPDRRDENGDLEQDLTKPSVIARANPSPRIDFDRIASARKMLLPEVFESEICGIGTWPNLDPVTV